MTAAELIAQLSTLDPATLILIVDPHDPSRLRESRYATVIRLPDEPGAPLGVALLGALNVDDKYGIAWQPL